MYVNSWPMYVCRGLTCLYVRFSTYVCKVSIIGAAYTHESESSRKHLNMGKSKFQKSWLDRPEYKNWLQEDRQDQHKAFCCVCRRSFDVTNMGEAALKSHSTGTKHVRNLQETGSTTGLARYFKLTTQSVVEPNDTDTGKAALSHIHFIVIFHHL